MWGSEQWEHMSYNPITAKELSEVSKKLRNKKPSASESLSNEIFKVAVEVLPSYFEKLFNIILYEGIFGMYVKIYIKIYIFLVCLVCMVKRIDCPSR